LRRADPTSKESYRLRNNDYEAEDRARAQQKAVEPLINEMKIETDGKWHDSREGGTFFINNSMLRAILI
jgi:hypothetical protein